ncbi:MAG: glycosyltransferase family 4 protein [Moraxellaceae bacterium]
MSGVIIHVVKDGGGYSGAVLQARLLLEHLESPTLLLNFFSSEKGLLREKALNVVNVRCGLAGIFKLAWLVLSRRASVLHIHGLIKEAMIAALLLPAVKVIVKSTLTGSDDFDSVRRYSLGIFKHWLLMRADVNVCISSRLYEINSRHPFRGEIRVIPNGVVSVGRPFSAAVIKPWFCVVGVVCPRKRTQLAIQYFIDHYSFLPDAMLFVVGPNAYNGVSAEITQEYQDMCESAIQASLKNKVVFVGQVGKAEVTNYYAQCIALLFFSENEGMPNVVLEAMAHGCVPVLSEIEGVARDIVEDGVQGRIIDPVTDVVDFGQIQNIYRSGAGIRRVKEHFSIESVAKKYERLYRDIL